jgi:hypothetical protein
LWWQILRAIARAVASPFLFTVFLGRSSPTKEGWKRRKIVFASSSSVSLETTLPGFSGRTTAQNALVSWWPMTTCAGPVVTRSLSPSAKRNDFTSQTSSGQQTQSRGGAPLNPSTVGL